METGQDEIKLIKMINQLIRPWANNNKKEDQKQVVCTAKGEEAASVVKYAACAADYDMAVHMAKDNVCVAANEKATRAASVDAREVAKKMALQTAPEEAVGIMDGRGSKILL